MGENAFAGSLRATRGPLRAEWTKPGAHPAHCGRFFWLARARFSRKKQFYCFLLLRDDNFGSGDASGLGR